MIMEFLFVQGRDTATGSSTFFRMIPFKMRYQQSSFDSIAFADSGFAVAVHEWLLLRFRRCDPNAKPPQEKCGGRF